jgi:sugar phosphate isomerase/epimerase
MTPPEARRRARTLLAVSTLGLPGATLGEAIEVATAAGCGGLELRAHPDTGVHAGMDGAERAAVRAALADAALAPLAVAGYVRVAAPGPDEPVLTALAAEVRLAADLAAPFVRVFPGGTDERAAASRLRAVATAAAGAGVKVLVETHDSHPTGAAVARLLDAAGVPETTGAIWDLVNPWRHGEDPADTLAALGDRLAYVQIKDAVSAADTTPVPLGTGAVPLARAGELLRAAGYAGWVSLEWERTWYPDVAPVAEILPGARAWLAEHGLGRAP